MKTFNLRLVYSTAGGWSNFHLCTSNMSFNQFMHPRNIYRRKPNYEELGKMYPKFGQFLVAGRHWSDNNRPNYRTTINYTDPNALRALTTTLLKHDFALDVQIPDGRLVPTLPMRLNYLLWVEDLLKCIAIPSNETIIGLDIGTGCCAIFPLLGATLNKRWSFVATDIDETNLTFAKLNVEANKYADRIKVIPGLQDTMFVSLLANQQVDKVHFTMTNPPFFSDEYNDSFEEDSNKETKFSAFHHTKVCSSNANEAVVEGGEVAFVKRIVEESLQMKDGIQLYTVMMGRRKSFLEIKYLLKDYQEKGDSIASFAYTELCQGNTKRWAIGWTFNRHTPLANAPRIKSVKSKPILHYIAPCIECCEYNMKAVAEYIKHLLWNNLQIHCSVIETKKSFEFDIKSNINTWSNQRKKRRQDKLKESFLKGVLKSDDESSNSLTLHSIDTSRLKRTFDLGYEDEIVGDVHMDEFPQTDNLDSAKRQKEESDICKSDLTFLLHCGLKVKRDKQQVYLKIVTKEMSQNKDSTFQVLQYLKNKLI